MDETQRIIFSLKKDLLGVESGVKELRRFESEVDENFVEKLAKRLKAVSLLEDKIDKKEFELQQVKKTILKKKDELYGNLKEKYKDKTESLGSQEKKIREELEKNSKRLSEIEKESESPGEKDSKKIIQLKDEVKRFESENSKFKKILDKEIIIKNQLEDKLGKNYGKSKEGSSNEGVIGKYIELFYVASKVAGGFYEGDLIIQSMKFYGEIIGNGNQGSFAKKLNQESVRDVAQQLKKYESNYKLKVLDSLDDSSDIEMRNKELEYFVHRKKSEYEVEEAKNKMNSGEFVGGGSFFVSFSDVMSVLLCFFVVFFAISDNDAEKFEEFFSTWPNRQKVRVKIKKPNNVSLSDKELAMLGKVKGLVEEGVDPETIKRNDIKVIELVIRSADLFINGDTRLSSKGSGLLKKKLQSSLTLGGIKQIRVEGHTDDIELKIHPKLMKRYRDNLIFSAARAGAVSKFISRHFKFPDKLIVVTGYGDFQPLRPNKSKANRALNRRIVLKILRDKSIRKSSKLSTDAGSK
tara:strand:- start:308 stop:1873 length:1566 start_codon:yes stop_codon:yes gene_type:complete